MTKPLLTPDQKIDEVVQLTQIQQIAGLALMGNSQVQISKQLGIKRHKVRELMTSEEFKETMLGVAKQSLDMAVSAFKSKMNALEPLAYSALRDGLADGKLEAVKLWGTYVGIGAEDDNKTQSPLTIVMPGANAPEAPAIQVVEAEVKDE